MISNNAFGSGIPNPLEIEYILTEDTTISSPLKIVGLGGHLKIDNGKNLTINDAITGENKGRISVSNGNIFHATGGGIRAAKDMSVNGNATLNVSNEYIFDSTGGGISAAKNISINGNSTLNVSNGYIKGNATGGGISAAKNISIDGNATLNVSNGYIKGNATGGGISADTLTIEDGSTATLSVSNNGDIFYGTRGSINVKTINLGDGAILNIPNEPWTITKDTTLNMLGTTATLRGNINIAPDGKLVVPAGKILRNYATIKLL